MQNIKHSNLLEHFIVYCKENFENENYMKYEEWLEIYADAFVNDILICKDIITSILKIKTSYINKTAKKNNIKMQYYNYDELPKKCIIHNIERIKQSRKQTWFVDIDNFMTLLLLYNNEENKKIITYMVKLNSLSREFFKKYGDYHLVKYENEKLKVLELNDKQKLIVEEYKKVLEERDVMEDRYKFMKRAAKHYGYDEDEDYYSFSDSHEYSEEEKCDVQYMKNYEP